MEQLKESLAYSIDNEIYFIPEISHATMGAIDIAEIQLKEHLKSLLSAKKELIEVIQKCARAKN